MFSKRNITAILASLSSPQMCETIFHFSFISRLTEPHFASAAVELKSNKSVLKRPWTDKRF